MPQSLAQLYVHLVFSTKERRQFLQDDGLRDRTFRYLAGIASNLNCPAVQVGGVNDHAHLLCRLGRSITVADLVRDLKRDSTKWIKTQEQQLAEFRWQGGYGIFSVSPAHVGAVAGYIRNQ